MLNSLVCEHCDAALEADPKSFKKQAQEAMNILDFLTSTTENLMQTAEDSSEETESEKEEANSRRRTKTKPSYPVRQSEFLKKRWPDLRRDLIQTEIPAFEPEDDEKSDPSRKKKKKHSKSASVGIRSVGVKTVGEKV